MPEKARYQAGMNDFEYCVSLFIEHPKIDPLHISKTIGIHPQTMHRFGEQRRTPKGQLLTGNYDKSYWNANLEVLDGHDPASSLQSIVRNLQSHRDFLHRIANEGGLIQLFIGLFATGLCDYEISHSLLHELADLRIDLRFDYYGTRGESAVSEK